MTKKRFTLTYKQIGEYWGMGIVDHQTKEPFDESKYEIHQTSFQASKDEMEDLCQLMNELNDENEQLNQTINKIKESIEYLKDKGGDVTLADVDGTLSKIDEIIFNGDVE